MKLPSWPPTWPEIDTALRASWTSGDWGRYHADAPHRLAQRIADHTGVHHVRLMPSGSAAIEWSLRLIGVGAGDAVILSALDYPGNFRAIELCGARPIVVDTLPQSPQPDWAQIYSVHASNVRAVIVSHLYGVSACDAAHREGCDAKGWTLIEDACQVPGMVIGGRPAGSIGHLGTWSFGGSKPLTAGAGGAILTDDNRLAARLASLLDRPGDSQPLAPLQAAVLLPQLESLKHWCKHRADTVRFLAENLRPHNSGIRIVLPTPPTIPSHYKCAIHFDAPEHRDAFLQSASTAALPVGETFRVPRNRRSGRRCEIPFGTINAADFADRVALLDHRALMIPEEERVELWNSLGFV
ncbi:MAG: DegT/DnrJ/EryC1/StrS aminotransferase family protein [Planctomycetota bacterium]